jgi:hypothetical protein
VLVVEAGKDAWCVSSRLGALEVLARDLPIGL